MPDGPEDLAELQYRREEPCRELGQVGDFRRGSLNKVRRKRREAALSVRSPGTRACAAAVNQAPTICGTSSPHARSDHAATTRALAAASVAQSSTPLTKSTTTARRIESGHGSSGLWCSKARRRVCRERCVFPGPARPQRRHDAAPLRPPC